MLPKATDVGLMVSSACVVTPLPLSAILSGEPGALLLIETVPLAGPDAEGENVTLKDAV